MIIRAALLADAFGMAQVHVATWRSTYGGLLPQQILDELDSEEREQRWEQTISAADPQHTVLVVVDGTAIVGFVHAGPARSEQPVYTGEVYSLYLLQAYHGRGWGGQLFGRAMGFLQEQAHSGALVWVLDGNPAAEFYAAQGGRRELRRAFTISGEVRHDTGYVWDWRPA